MSPSTATKKSTCLALALLAMASAESSLICDGGDCSSSIDYAFGSATMINRVPIHLQLASDLKDKDVEEMSHRNVSAYYEEEEEIDEQYPGFDEDELMELPAELAAMIASAQSLESHPAAAPTLASKTATTAGGASGGEEERFYATFDYDGELCSTRRASDFGAWEEHFATLDECCQRAYGWDVEGCVSSVSI